MAPSNRQPNLQSTRTRVIGYIALAVFLILIASLAVTLIIDSTILQPVNQVSNLLLIGVTGIYAYLTWSLVIENRQARKEERIPVLALELNAYGPKIANIGNGTAIDLELSMKLEPATQTAEPAETELSREVLPVNEDEWVTEEPFTQIVDQESTVHDAYTTFTLNATYHDIFGEEYTYDFEQESLTEFVSDEIPPKTPVEDIANQLASINSVLLTISEEHPSDSQKDS